MKTGRVNVRYIVEKVGKAAEFYETSWLCDWHQRCSCICGVTRDNLRLLLRVRKSSAGRAMPDGTLPVPGGWNRIELVVENLKSEVERLKREGLYFRNDIVTGAGGSQILLIAPSGSFVKLFEPKK